MAKHRTRIQKQKTKTHRGHVRAPVVPIVHERVIQQPASQLVKAPAMTATDKRPVSIPPMTQSLLRVDKRYLVADIRRSAIVSSILFAVLIGIFLLVRYNGLTRLQSQFYSMTQSTGK